MNSRVFTSGLPNVRQFTRLPIGFTQRVQASTRISPGQWASWRTFMKYRG
jgi:hypothetical protein